VLLTPPLLLHVLLTPLLLLQVLLTLTLLPHVFLHCSPAADWQTVCAPIQAVLQLAGAQRPLLLDGQKTAPPMQQAAEHSRPAQGVAAVRWRAGAPACIHTHDASPFWPCNSHIRWLEGM
jgi:hypothetical protein